MTRSRRGWAGVLGTLIALGVAAAWGLHDCRRGQSGPRPASTVLVFAAASTADLVDDLAKRYESANPGVKIARSYASTSTLARQIEAGAPAGLFVAAHPRWLEALDAEGLLERDPRAPAWLTNRLVLIAPRGRGFAVRFEPELDFAGAFAGRLALGDPAHVPAGVYAREALSALGWWASIEGRILPAHDVRAALALVELGEAGAGIVYATNARASEAVEVVAEVPSRLHEPIVYPLALRAGADAATRAFFAYLTGPDARARIAAHGFEPAP